MLENNDFENLKTIIQNATLVDEPQLLQLLPHILEKIGAKITMKSELRTENQDAGISATSEANSLLSIHITMPQMMAKLNPKKKLESIYFPNMLRNNSYKT